MGQQVNVFSELKRKLKGVVKAKLKKIEKVKYIRPEVK